MTFSKLPMPAAVLERAALWRRDAAARRQYSGVDPVADTLEACAAQIEADVARVDRETAYLTVEEYAAHACVSVSTIRRLCARGELQGVVKSAADEWRIPRGAQRIERRTHNHGA